MAYALDEGILQFNVESEPELEALNEVAKSKGVQAPIALRINPDVKGDTHIKISTGQKESKFGIPIAQARHLYNRAADMEGIRVQGVSIHIGSQLTDLMPFREAFIRLKEFTQGLRAEGHTISVLDVGGGLGIPYSQDNTPTPEAYGRVVKDIFADETATLVFEPGRLIAGNAGILVTRIIYIKKGEDRTFVIVDAGMNDLMRPALYGAHHDIVPITEPGEKTYNPVDIVGPVCENSDIFAEQRPMPSLQQGDLLAIRSCGAYGAVMANTYNARPLIKEVMVDGEDILSD